MRRRDAGPRESPRLFPGLQGIPEMPWDSRTERRNLAEDPCRDGRERERGFKRELMGVSEHVLRMRVGMRSRGVRSRTPPGRENPFVSNRRGNAAVKQPNVAVYGSRSCPDTTRSTKLLDSKGVQYEFKDVDALPEYNDYIAGLNSGKRVLPTIRVDNEILINPTDDELSRAIEDATTERA